MGFLRSEWCFCGYVCDGPGGSERIRGGVLSNKGAVVSINSTGTGILIHRALVLTTHGNLPSITAAEDSEILVTTMGAADSEDYRRKLAPNRFFITNSVLDLTIVACDPTEIEVVQPLCLQNSVAHCLDFGRVVYLLGRQATEEKEKDLMVGDGKITVGTDTLIKFSTDGVIWSPGSAGFDSHGNLAFMICDPMKLVSASQRKRASATTFWRKEFPKQFGIPVPVIRHWLNQNWKSNIEELDRPRIPARLKVNQKERSSESSSNSIRLKRVPNGGSLESSDNSEKLKDFFKHMGEDEEVSSIPSRPGNEFLDGLGISSTEIQVKKNDNLTRSTLLEDLNFDRPRLPEGKREIPNGLTNHEEKRQPKEFGECSSPVLQIEECLNKEGFCGAYQSGPGKEDEYLEEKSIIIPWGSRDAEGPNIMLHLKGPQKEDKVDVVCRESDPLHQNEVQKVSLPASEIEIENETQKHYNFNFAKMVCRETSPAQTGIIHKKNQQLLDITSPKPVNEETIPIQSSEIQKGKHQLLEIKFPSKLEKDIGKGIIFSQFKDPMPSIPIKIGNVEQKKQAKWNISSIQDEAAGPSHEHKGVCKGSSTFPHFGDPMSNTSVVEDPSEKKQRKEMSSYMKGIWKRTTPKESNIFRKDEKDGKRSIIYPQVREPMPIICIKPKHREEKKQNEEKSSTPLQEGLQKSNVECSESNFSAEHDQGRESLWNLAEIRRPISTNHHLDLNQEEEQKHANENLSSKSKLIKPMEDADIYKEYQAAEFEAKGRCSDNGSEEDYGIQMSHISSLFHASSQRYTDSSDVETMYSAETRESRNYSPRESNGKKNSAQVRRTQSSISTVRGVHDWNCSKRNSLPGRSKSAYHTRKNQVHPSCSRKISVKMPSYRGPDYFGPTVSSIMKKRNLDSINNNKGTFQQSSPRWIF